MSTGITFTLWLIVVAVFVWMRRLENNRFLAKFDAASERVAQAANEHRRLDKELTILKARIKVAEQLDDREALRMALQDLALFEAEVIEVRDRLGK